VNTRDRTSYFPPTFEPLEPRLLLSVDLPGMHLVDPSVDRFDGQVVYFDFDGEQDVTYNGPVTVGPFDVPAFCLPGALASQEETVAASVLERLNEVFANAGLTFTAQEPGALTPHSTVYVGDSDAAFSDYGSFLGLAEQVDIRNQDSSDKAFLFSLTYDGLSMEGSFHTLAC